jgi:hypothetical protein
LVKSYKTVTNFSNFNFKNAQKCKNLGENGKAGEKLARVSK